MNRKSVLAESILKKSFDDCSVEELEKLANQYPYFAPVQYLFTEKLRVTDHATYEKQLQKLALFFHNPFWLDHLLHEDGNPAEPVKSKMAEIMVSIANVQKEIPETELSFEPYHTIDYFASQGIKTVADEKPKDKFGQQLKSFTEWLRVMKKLPLTEIEKKIDTNAERQVEQLAEKSLTDDEVITETMAEVWLKQGDIEKAIEIYNKLSLLNPSKSDYFAAKIQEIKSQ
jgi:tetratricopeptide (TPR) repeat protein